ncbi:uncharacterized protein KQ657_002430 [Scheffersomyces spartinae]|uniref:U3 small nucleolar RNA-associated protein 14 n=1 Tax=Scheffersomyces spartinae TaxID=45513 RepID=A0A9P8AGS5_9ASCO|nr:uncharacterized protein KQ657_002430 [Scheffersomyces spartinae]KAG7192070.1 hypothetical protein KQ657_002430 [Scheffersomyces spartinae]
MARKDKLKSSTRRRSAKKALDAFQIAERAENGRSDGEDSEGELNVYDGIMDARRLLNKGKSEPDDFEEGQGLEDEEIDSDEAFGSDDDFDVLNSKFSQTIRDRAKRQKQRAKRRAKGEDVSELEASGDEGYASVDESKFVSLSEAWAMDDVDLAKLKKANGEVVLDDEWESESEQDGDSDEEDGDEEDEEDDNDDDSDVFEGLSDGDEEVDLLSTISHLKSQLKDPKKERKKLVTERIEENEFSVPTGGAKLSLNSMLSAVDSSVAQDAILIDEHDDEDGGDKSKALAVPLPKRIQQRHDRKAAYEITKEEITKWEDTIQANRQAEVLKFPLNPTVRHNDTATTFRSQATPTTELEKKVHSVLEQSALVDERKEATFEELAVAKMSAEEIKKRTNELRLMRELMFRDEARARRIKKIKSKQYRKIKKKERLRNQELVEGSDIESDVEDHDMKRAQERMTLKHKTQSKWAQSMIKSGLSKDADNRSELEEMLRQGERLRAKQLGYEDGDQSDDVVLDVEREYNNDENDEEFKSKLGKGVLAMDFMRNAQEQQKQENLRELELLRKLENGGDMEEFEGSVNSVSMTKNQGRRVYTPSASSQKQAMEDLNSQTRASVEEDEAKSLENKLKVKEKTKFVINKEATVSEVTPENLTCADLTPSGVNPWLKDSADVPSQKSNKITTVDKTSSKLAKAAAKISKKRKLSHEDDADAVVDMNQTLRVVDIHGPDSDSEAEGDGDVRVFKQQDLIKQAFAGDDVVNEFEREKQQVIEDEDDKEEDLTLPGWGDWAGGLNKNKKNKRRKIIKKIDGVVQKDKRKDKNLKNVIINEKVNKKNLKYQSSAVPFPYESREQYERALRMPVGQEWTSRETHQKLTMPRVITKQGTVIDPLKAPFK